MGQRVVVAMSGGVDSSVAAALLVRQGHDVIGVSMRLWSGEGENASGCCTLDDFLDARRVAQDLGIPFYVLDMQDDFRRAVVDPFVAEYAAGRTPNPCVRCNQFVKFGSFWERARALGADLVATGHYARVERGRGGAAELRRGAEPAKDQSYFLFAMSRRELERTLFPVGHLAKSQVRALAAEIGLPVAAKPDSQEVCFAPGRRHSEFVATRLGERSPRPGDIVDAGGAVVGRHQGVHTVTVGQRRGLGLSGGPPRWVTRVDAGTATVHVGAETGLDARGLEAADVNWLVETPPARGTEFTVRIRSRHPGAKARLRAADEHSFALDALDELRAVTPGQAAVLYDGDRVVGGGWIR
jgi:tRNA-specific 2-thiouridylase